MSIALVLGPVLLLALIFLLSRIDVGRGTMGAYERWRNQDSLDQPVTGRFVLVAGAAVGVVLFVLWRVVLALR